MGVSTSGDRVRRRKVRRMAANWAELHRQEEAAERSNPVYPIIARVTSGVIIMPAVAGLWHLAWGAPVGELEWGAMGVVAGVLVLWNASASLSDLRAWWVRRRSARRRIG